MAPSARHTVRMQGDPAAQAAVAAYRPAQDPTLRAALDAAIDGHALYAPWYDEGGALVDLVGAYLNPAGVRMRDLAESEFVGLPLLARSVDVGNPPLGDAYVAVARTGVPLRRRDLAARGGGAVLHASSAGDGAGSTSHGARPGHGAIGGDPEQRWIELAAVRLDGGLSVSFRDITHEVRARHELEQANHALAAANAQLATLASTDPLTGVANRRAWNAQLLGDIEQARLDGRPLSVALVDLDRFKAYNDTFGHPAGDQLLIAATRAWADCLPAGATLARLGGEEFAVALPGTDPVAARDALSCLCAITPDGQTASAGVTVWDRREEPSALLGRADAALYAAKRNGRDRVEVLVGG